MSGEDHLAGLMRSGSSLGEINPGISPGNNKDWKQNIMQANETTITCSRTRLALVSHAVTVALCPVYSVMVIDQRAARFEDASLVD